jgi:hypothetical protein
MRAIPIYVGYDPREAIAYHVCCQSIVERASGPVAFIPLALNTLRGYDNTGKDGSNSFIYSRFLVPWLERWGNGNKHALFLDGDMIVRDDIYKLWALRRHDMGVQVVKHDYKTKHAIKYLGAKNEDYPKKNWSSVCIWNCGYLPNRVLTPEYVEKAPGSYLHRFEWLKDEQVGALPAEWNHLTMEYPPRANDDAKLYHYTVGAPCFGGEYADQEGGGEWQRTLRNALAPLGGPAAIG